MPIVFWLITSKESQSTVSVRFSSDLLNRFNLLQPPYRALGVLVLDIYNGNSNTLESAGLRPEAEQEVRHSICFRLIRLAGSRAARTAGGDGGNGQQARSADRAGGRRQGWKDDTVQPAGPGAAAERPPGRAHTVPR